MAEAKNNQTPDVSEQDKIRRGKLADLQAAGNDPFLITKYNVTHHSMEIKNNFDELEGQEVTVAGRMMQKRVMGKASFCNVRDLQGDIQSYVARDELGTEAYQAFKKFDIGDIIGIKGKVFKTKTGEISIHATEITLLSKSLHTLPEKFHGLTNTDIRYRQRYVDLIMNPDVKQTFINQLIFAAMYIGISFFIMIFTVGYVHEITYLIIVLIALGIILRDWLKLKGKSRVIRGEYQKRRMVHFFRTSEVKDIAVYRNKSKLYVRMSNGIKEMTCEAELCNEEKENFDDMVQQGVSVIFRNQNNKISLMSFMEKKGVRMKC